MADRDTDTDASLIPGLPDEISETCFLQLPYPYQALVRSVSFSWNRTINDPVFLLSRKTLPYIFVFAYNKSTGEIQWQAFNPRSKSNRWFILPPMPFPYPVSRAGFATASIPEQGTLCVLGGTRSDTEKALNTFLTYNTATNKWSVEEPMLNPRAFCAAGCIGTRIFAAGGYDDTTTSMECYEPDTATWAPVAEMRCGLARYDTAVIASKMYVTEGWTWPFSFSPRGGVYDSEKNVWEEMSLEMREGWTGISVVHDEKLFVISEHGECRVKYYLRETDTWHFVGGKGFPYGEVQRPFCVSGVEGKIYVVSCGLNVVVGSVYEEGKLLGIDWEVVKAPKAFQEFVPSNSQIVYG